MKNLPSDVQFYKRTSVFTQETMPGGLRKDHATGAGVWGVICVERGEMEYTISGQGVYRLRPGENGVIEPQTLHHVKPLGEVSFFIEFFR